jgi:hypothetical protein
MDPGHQFSPNIGMLGWLQPADADRSLAGAHKLTSFHYIYSVFGLRLRVNLALPQISSVQLDPDNSRGANCVDLKPQEVWIEFGASPRVGEAGPPRNERVVYKTDDVDSAGTPALKVSSVGNLLRLDYFDGTTFWLDDQGTQIWVTWPENLTIEDTATYLLGPVLGLLLRLRGVVCLHASAVSFGDYTVALMGPEGAGKSTTAAALARQGCGIVSDDVVALTEVGGVFHVQPAYPYLSLWPESVQSIYGNPDVLPRFSRNYEKRCLSLSKQKLRFEHRCLPLRAIYLLGVRRPDPAPTFQQMAPQKSLLALVANTFATNMLDAEMRAQEFATLGRLIRSTEVCEVFAHQDSERLPELGRMLWAESERINATSQRPTSTVSTA